MDHERLEGVEATAWADLLRALPAEAQAALGTTTELVTALIGRAYVEKKPSCA